LTDEKVRVKEVLGGDVEALDLLHTRLGIVFRGLEKLRTFVVVAEAENVCLGQEEVEALVNSAVGADAQHLLTLLECFVIIRTCLVGSILIKKLTKVKPQVL